MTRKKFFNMAVNEQERAMIAAVADKLQRSQASTMRLLVRSAAEELGVEQPASRLVQSAVSVESSAGGESGDESIVEPS